MAGGGLLQPASATPLTYCRMNPHVNPISRYFLTFAALLVIAAPGFSQPLPDCYHRLDQLYAFIDSLQAAHPDIVRVDSIGHSRGDQLGHQYPIYAVKISDNVNTFEDEPVMLIVCHIHAEEVIGLEVSLDYMTRLVSGFYNTLLNNTQIYFIPTMNPDGLQVISYGVPSGDDTLWDNTWRKNGYVPPELAGGSCNVAPGSGGELCGVDLNRNFELNWIFGDTLWRPAATELYDYYRGPSPFSEPECRAVRDLAVQIKPALSIVYHSSRSGNIAEQAIVPWKWGNDGPFKFAPDCTAVSQIVHPYCALLQKDNGNQYDVVLSVGHNGCLQDWFYWRLGCIQALTELGPGVNIQPSCPTLEDLVQDDRNSLNWMHRRLLNVGSDMSNEPAVLRIYTRDPGGNPLSAEWRNLNTWNPGLAPWYTNEQFGRATFFPPLGPDTIMARREGYRPDTVTVVVNPSGMASAILTLEPLPWHAATFHIRDAAGNEVQGNIHLDYDYPKWVAVPAGGQMVNLVEGGYRAMVVPDDPNLLVTWRDFYLGGDAEVDVWCPTATALWNENFEGGLASWTSGGEGNNWRLVTDTTTFMFGQSLYTNPPTGSSWPYVYPNNADTWMEYNNPINLTGGANVAVLRFDRRERMEVPADSVFVEVSTDNQIWHKAAGFCEMNVPWSRTYVNLAPWAGSNVYLRFRLVTDFAVGELGMFIDNLQVLIGLDSSAPIPPGGVPYSYRIVSAYPNPFNPSTTIQYETAAAGTVEWSIFNITGQLVRHDEITVAAAGSHTFVWNGTNSGSRSVPTGLYFARMNAGGHVATQKLLLLR